MNLKRAWNLAATLLLASPALGEVGWNVVVWVVYLSLVYVIGQGATMASTALTRARKAQAKGTRSSRPAVELDAGSIPAASTYHLNPREGETS